LTGTKGSRTAGEVPGYCFPQASTKLNQGEKNGNHAIQWPCEFTWKPKSD
jgi:hypothetical protein